MSSLVKQILVKWRVSDGRLFELIYEGEDEDLFNDHKILDPYPRPLAMVEVFLRLDDATKIVLPVDEIPHILPDRTGVLVIFDRNRPSAEGLLYCPPPNNAAIFNADGSIRFQLQNPFGAVGSFRAALHNRLANGVVELGVRVCPSDYPACETVYTVDGSTPDLIKQLPRWVRD